MLSFNSDLLSRRKEQNTYMSTEKTFKLFGREQVAYSSIWKWSHMPAAYIDMVAINTSTNS